MVCMQRFLIDRRGNVATMFAIFLIPMLIAAGVGIDYARASLVRNKLHESADAGLLAAARAMSINAEMTVEEAKEVAMQYFTANGGGAVGIDLDDFEFEFDEATKTFSLRVTGEFETSLLKIAKMDSIPISIHTEAKVAAPKVLEVALVVDNTYSMTGTKITALKSAANDLVDIILDETNEEEVKISLVPFSQYVNVGIDRRVEDWIDIEDDYSTTEYRCSISYPDLTRTNCTTETRTCYRDGIPYDCNYTTCEYDYGEPQETCSDRTYNYVWNGCVGSRGYPLNIEDDQYGVTQVPGLANYSCPQELLPLTSDKTAIETAIEAMYPQGETYIPSGLTWGHRVLSSRAPFTEGFSQSDDAADGGKKVLILMTDGANTKSPNYPYHSYSDGVLSNQLTEELCNNIKDDEIEIYTIAFEVTDPTIGDILSACASAPSYYFMAMDAAALGRTFEAIGGELHALALTK